MKKIALVFVCVAAPAFAQPNPKAKEPPPPKPLFLPFEDDNVFGDRAIPDGSVVEARKPRHFGNLHAVRKHFVPEMFKAAENL